MSSTILPTVIIAAVAGGAAAALTSTVLTPEPKEEEVAAITPTTDDSELSAEVETLRQQNASLLDRIEALEMTAALAGEKRQPVAVDTKSDDNMKAELDALLASMKNAGNGDVDPNFQASVSAALDNIRAAEEAEKEAKREERRIERVEERLGELSEKLGLNTTQVNDLRDLYGEYEQKRNDMMALARELDDWGSMRDNFRTLRDEGDAALQGIFSPAQYQQYKDENLGGRGGILSTGGRGWGDRGGGGGNDGGGGGRRGRGN